MKKERSIEEIKFPCVCNRCGKIFFWKDAYLKDREIHDLEEVK